MIEPSSHLTMQVSAHPKPEHLKPHVTNTYSLNTSLLNSLNTSLPESLNISHPKHPKPDCLTLDTRCRVSGDSSSPLNLDLYPSTYKS